MRGCCDVGSLQQLKFMHVNIGFKLLYTRGEGASKQ